MPPPPEVFEPEIEEELVSPVEEDSVTPELVVLLDELLRALVCEDDVELVVEVEVDVEVHPGPGLTTPLSIFSMVPVMVPLLVIVPSLVKVPVLATTMVPEHSFVILSWLSIP